MLFTTKLRKQGIKLTFKICHLSFDIKQPYHHFHRQLIFSPVFCLLQLTVSLSAKCVKTDFFNCDEIELQMSVDTLANTQSNMPANTKPQLYKMNYFLNMCTKSFKKDLKVCSQYNKVQIKFYLFLLRVWVGLKPLSLQQSLNEPVQNDSPSNHPM